VRSTAAGLDRVAGPFHVQVGPRTEEGRLYRIPSEPGKPRVYCVEHPYFDRAGLYGESGMDYPDNLQRWAFFCRAALEMLPRVTRSPCVLHCHDWHTALAPIYLTVMVSAAVATSMGRLRTVARAVALRAAGTAIVTGATVSTVVILASGALPLSSRTAVPMAAQLIGGAMTATTLAGRRMVDDVVDGWAGVEGWLALGAAPSQAVAAQGRRAAARAGEPNLDQTRNVGLVVLPGSFVGLLLGGASPAQAAATQLLVLLGLMAAQTVAAVLVTRLLAGELGRRRPG